MTRSLAFLSEGGDDREASWTALTQALYSSANSATCPDPTSQAHETLPGSLHPAHPARHAATHRRGFGWLAFSAIQAELARAATGSAGGFTSPLLPKAPHFPARAKRVIFLFMQGGPSHLDTFDWKPDLKANGGKSGGSEDGKSGTLLAPQFEFTRGEKADCPSARSSRS